VPIVAAASGGDTEGLHGCWEVSRRETRGRRWRGGNYVLSRSEGGIKGVVGSGGSGAEEASSSVIGFGGGGGRGGGGGGGAAADMSARVRGGVVALSRVKKPRRHSRSIRSWNTVVIELVVFVLLQLGFQPDCSCMPSHTFH